MELLTLTGGPSRSGRSLAATRAVAAATLAALPDGEERVVPLGEAPTREEIEAAVDAMNRAEVILIGSPVYRGDMPAPLKALLDATPRNEYGDPREPLRAKPVGLCMVGGSLHHFLAIDTLRAILTGFFGVHVLAPGLYFASQQIDDDGVLEPRAAEQVQRYGEALAEFARFVSGSTAMRAVRPLI